MRAAHAALAAIQATMATAGLTDLLGPRVTIIVMACLAGGQAFLAVYTAGSTRSLGVQNVAE